MKKIFGLRSYIDLTLAVIIIGGLVYALGFGLSLWIARQEVMHETDQKVEDEIAYVNGYVDNQLQRVEDIAFTLISSKFGGTYRDNDGNGFIVIDPATFRLPSEEEVFQIVEQFLNANPFVCGAAIGFEPFVYPNTQGKYGFSAYVTNVSGKNERFSLGQMHDFRQKEWYREAAATNKPYWSRPFRETSQGKVVTCYSLPLHGFGGRLVGVLAVDINTAVFRDKCRDVAPFPGAEVTLVDREFRFICHPDTSFLLKSVKEVGAYDDYKADDSMRIKMEQQEAGHYDVVNSKQEEALFYFAPLPRTGWTLTIECPKKSVYSGVDRMKRDTTVIAIVSLLFMALSLIWIFRRLQSATASKAGIVSELKVASSIQMGMIPKLYPAFPKVPELDVCGYLRPAKSVGGDLYDYQVRDGKLYFCIGDVSGKGVPASLFMMVVLALFRSAVQHCTTPADIVQNINDSVSRNNAHCMFCTMFVGVLDLATGDFDYCNAGHNAPVIRRVNPDGTVDVRYMDLRTNLAVGMFEMFKYVGESTKLKPHEAVFLYTDGVTEAEDIHHNLFGDPALLAALADARSNNARTAKEFIEHMGAAVNAHAGEAEQSDDITMLVVEFRAPHLEK